MMFSCGKRRVGLVFFVISKLFWFLAEPGNLATIVAATGCLLLCARSPACRHAGRWAVCAGVAFWALVAWTPMATWIARPLEERFPLPEIPKHLDGIILLGGAVDPLTTRERGGIVALNGAAERVTGFVALAREHPEARLVTSGGSGMLLHQDLKESVALRSVFTEIGFTNREVIFEADSRNTWENAVNSRRIVHPRPGEVWVLVTSAMHMPRSVGVFRAAGWPVLPYPVDYRTHPGGTAGWFEPVHTKLSLLAGALREWIGLIVYRATGRSSSWFPSL